MKHNKRKKLGVAEQDMFHVIDQAHQSNDRFHGQLGSDLFYGKIQASARGAGAQSTRYVVTTKKDGKYFVLGFYKKAEQEYPPRSDINRYLAYSSWLLDATDAELADFADLIEELRKTPPSDWPEGVSMDEAMDMLAKESIEVEHERAVARKRKGLTEKARLLGSCRRTNHLQNAHGKHRFCCATVQWRVLCLFPLSPICLARSISALPRSIHIQRQFRSQLRDSRCMSWRFSVSVFFISRHASKS